MKKIVLFINKLLFVGIVASVFCASCTSDTEKEKKVNKDSLELAKKNKVAKPEIFKVPSPIEFYQFMKDQGIRYDKTMLANADNASKYVTSKSKAMNFGIFASDLAYCTVYGRSQETFQYFKSSKVLADGLGLAEGFDDIVSKRLNANMNNSDSLYQITNDAYADACQYLEGEDKSEVLAYILAGSWVESIYLAMSSLKKFNDKDPVIIRIAEQQLILENLNSSFQNIDKKDPDFIDMKDKMKKLQTVFDKLYDNTDVLITKKQYDEIFLKIKEFRKEIIA